MAKKAGNGTPPADVSANEDEVTESPDLDAEISGDPDADDPDTAGGEEDEDDGEL